MRKKTRCIRDFQLERLMAAGNANRKKAMS
jgi:hypothetical protein